jgi:D-alanyl-lipoteichoic acid acyltransferase DltB (MBOAT superfamily)
MVAFVPIIGLIVTVELMADADCKLSKSYRWRIRRAQVDSALLLRGVWPILLSVIVGSAAFLTLGHTRHSAGIAMAVLRLAAGVALVYALAGFIFEVCGLCFLVAGYSLPPMHRAPIAARSVGEFWGQRWNMIVSAWLRTFVFWPLARRRLTGVGVLCCFLVSGAFHGWPMLAALGRFAALSTLAFFVIQGVVVLAENRLSIHTWPVAIARAWTLVILLTSSPLFIDPGLRLFGL